MLSLIRKNSPLLGIDIGTTAVKLVELSRTATTFRVEHYAIEPLPKTAVVEKKIIEHGAVAESIKRAVRRSGTKVKRAAVALAGSAVITKIITLPAVFKEAEIEAQIQLDADQYIPYPLEEVNLDFNVLGPLATDPTLVEILLAASRRENVDDRVSVLEIADLTPVVVDVEAYAIEHACSMLLDLPRPTDKTSGILGVVDIGASTTTLHVFSGGRSLYTREQNFGGRQLHEEVQRRYSLSEDEAAQKIRAGDVAENYSVEILNPFKEALAQQIGRALQFFYSGTTFNSIDRLLLTGGPANIPRIDVVIEDRLKIPTVVANPFSQMTVVPRIQSKALLHDASSLMVAVGLALRGFD